MTASTRTSWIILLGTLLAAGSATVFAQTGAASPQTDTTSSQAGSSSETPSQSSSGSSSRSESSGAPSTGSASQSGAGTPTLTVPMVVLVPIEVQADPNLYNSCWVRLTDKEAMPKRGNDILTIVGRMAMPSFQTASGVDWTGKADSLIVGPKASVTVYENQSFRGRAVSVKAGTQEPQLRDKMQFTQSIDSLKIACNQ